MRKYLLIIPLIFILSLGSIILAGYLFVKDISSPVQKSQASMSQIVASFQNRDLITAKTESEGLQRNVGEIDNKYQRLSGLKMLPLIGAYVNDGQRLINAAKSANDAIDGLIVAIEPYSDLVGFKTEAQVPLANQSIEDKVVFLAETLNKISPQLDVVTSQIDKAKSEIDQINPNRYPNSIFGKQIRSKIIALKSTVDESAQLLSQSKPLMKLMPDLLGNPNPKTYMLLFQNDAELRPTGGFMTAYAYIKVTKGKIEPLGSFDIYDLDARWNKRLPAPEPIKKYLPLGLERFKNSR